MSSPQQGPSPRAFAPADGRGAWFVRLADPAHAAVGAPRAIAFGVDTSPPPPAAEGVTWSFPIDAPDEPEGAGALARLARAARLPLLVLVLYTALFHLSVVRGNSMAPGIHDGDRILVEPWSYLLGNVERGDVVVLRYPLDPSVDYIKRVVALAGDEVLVRGGKVWIDGQLLDEPYVEFVDPHSVVHTVVEPGHVFVLGDNRPKSSDSRDFGQVPMDYLRGRVDLRLWPLGRVGFVE